MPRTVHETRAKKRLAYPHGSQAVCERPEHKPDATTKHENSVLVGRVDTHQGRNVTSDIIHYPKKH